MSIVAVRIPVETHAKLKQMADDHHETVGHIVAKMVEEIEEQRFWAEFRAPAARIRADPDAWRELQEERRIYDGTLMDGLEPMNSRAQGEIT